MKYEIYRDGVKIDETENKQYVDDTLLMGKEYEFQVKDEEGNESEKIKSKIPVSEVISIVLYDRSKNGFGIRWYDFGANFTYDVYLNNKLVFADNTNGDVFFEGMKPNTKCDVMIKSKVNGYVSEGIGISTKTLDYADPMPPNEIKVNDIRTNRLDLFWGAIIDDEPVSVVVKYEGEEKEVTDNKIVIDNLKADTHYTVSFVTKGLESGKLSNAHTVDFLTKKPYMYVSDVNDTNVLVDGYPILEDGEMVELTVNGNIYYPTKENQKILVDGLNSGTEYEATAIYKYNNMKDSYTLEPIKFETTGIHEFSMRITNSLSDGFILNVVDPLNHDHTYGIYIDGSFEKKGVKAGERVEIRGLKPTTEYVIKCCAIESGEDMYCIKQAAKTWNPPTVSTHPYVYVDSMLVTLDGAYLRWEKPYIAGYEYKTRIYYNDVLMKETSDLNIQIDGLEERTLYELKFTVYLPQFDIEGPAYTARIRTRYKDTEQRFFMQDDITGFGSLRCNANRNDVGVCQWKAVNKQGEIVSYNSRMSNINGIKILNLLPNAEYDVYFSVEASDYHYSEWEKYTRKTQNPENVTVSFIGSSGNVALFKIDKTKLIGGKISAYEKLIMALDDKEPQEYASYTDNFAWTGTTIGHHVMQVKVRDENGKYYDFNKVEFDMV